MIISNFVLTFAILTISVHKSTQFRSCSITPFRRFTSKKHHYLCQKTGLDTYKKNLILFMNDLDSADLFPEGEELAKELYEEVKIREFRAKLEEDIKIESSKVEEYEKRARNNKPFSRRKEVKNGKDVPVSKRFLKDNDEMNLFSMGPDSTLFNSYNLSGSGNNRVRANMMSQEFSLLEQSSSERGILIQASFVVLLLIFYLYVGITGGITDGGAGGEFAYEEVALPDASTFFESISSLEDTASPASEVSSESVWL